MRARTTPEAKNPPVPQFEPPACLHDFDEKFWCNDPAANYDGITRLECAWSFRPQARHVQTVDPIHMHWDTPMTGFIEHEPMPVIRTVLTRVKAKLRDELRRGNHVDEDE